MSGVELTEFTAVLAAAKSFMDVLHPDEDPKAADLDLILAELGEAIERTQSVVPSRGEPTAP